VNMCGGSTERNGPVVIAASLDRWKGSCGHTAPEKSRPLAPARPDGTHGRTGTIDDFTARVWEHRATGSRSLRADQLRHVEPVLAEVSIQGLDSATASFQPEQRPVHLGPPDDGQRLRVALLQFTVGGELGEEIGGVGPALLHR